MVNYSSENPYKTAIYVRIIYIPPCIKNYTLSVCNIGQKVFQIVSIPFWIFYSLLYTVIGSEISKHSDQFREKTWAEITDQQKFSIILTYVIIFLTIVQISLLVYWSNQKIKEMRAQAEIINDKIKQEIECNGQEYEREIKSPDKIDKN